MPPQPTDPIIRLMKKVKKTDTCWLWTGTINTFGYGKIGVPPKGKTVKVHRLAYEHFIGPIPEGLTLDHLCRVPACVNPDHLEPVTNKENLRRIPNSPGTRTHCPQGHEYSPENTHITKLGHRKCRICYREINRVTYQKRMATKRALNAV